MSDAGETVCVYCKARTETHCATAGCDWRSCTECGAVLWGAARRALRRGKPVAWPYTQPESA